MNITAIKKGFVFQFADAVNAKGEFEKGVSDGGIILKATFDDSAKQTRWVNIVASGSTCTDVVPGVQALLPALRWTESSNFNGQKIWKSDETQAAAVRASETAEVQPLANYVIFKQIKPAVQQQTSGLLVVIGNIDNTPKGEVVSIGPDASADLVGSYIYYNDANFFETFVHNGVEYAFIKDEDILAYEPK